MSSTPPRPSAETRTIPAASSCGPASPLCSGPTPWPCCRVGSNPPGPRLSFGWPSRLTFASRPFTASFGPALWGRDRSSTAPAVAGSIPAAGLPLDGSPSRAPLPVFAQPGEGPFRAFNSSALYRRKYTSYGPSAVIDHEAIATMYREYRDSLPMAASDIAQLTGYSTETVHQWAKRHPAFRALAEETSAGMIWRRGDVDGWLRETGRRA